MSSRCNTLGFSVLLTMGATLALSGCVDNDISLSVNQFVGPDTAMASSNVCEFDSSSIAISRGVFDATLADNIKRGYTADFSVTNNLQEVTTQDVEMQAYYIQSFDVEIVPQGAANSAPHMIIPTSMRKYSYPVATQRLIPGATAFFSVQAISADLANAFAAQTTPGSIEIRVRPVATRAEEEQHGAYASFPIDICNGCLTGTTSYPPCSELKGVTPVIGNVCNYSQDEAVTCCMQGKTTVCGSNVTLASSET